MNLPSLIPPELIKRSAKKEEKRICYIRVPGELNCQELEEVIYSVPGPRLVVLNTTKNAALFSAYLRGRGRSVEHISTALIYCDIKETISKVMERVKKNRKRDWVFVATSMIENGTDFSFMNGGREKNSIGSYKQTSGRINRECDPKYKNSRLFIFKLKMGQQIFKMVSGKKIIEEFSENRSFLSRIDIADHIIKKHGKRKFNLTHKDVTKHFKDNNIGRCHALKDPLIVKEKNTQFESVWKDFSVIDNEGALCAVTDRKLFLDARKRMEAGMRIPWREIHEKAFRVSGNKKNMCYLEGLTGDPETEYEQLYFWRGRYDKFVGYYAQYLHKLYK